MNDAEDVLNTLKWQAWERAKGELLSMREAMYGGLENNLQINKLTTKFIKDVEDLK